MNTSNSSTCFSRGAAAPQQEPERGGDILLSSGDLWRGIRLEERELGAGEEGECAFVNDVLILSLPSSDVVDIKVAGDPHRQKLVANSLNILPAHTSIRSSIWRARIHFLTMEISRHFVNAMYPDRGKPIELLQHIGVLDQYVSSAMLALRQDITTGCTAGAHYGESISAALLVHVAAKYGAESERRAEWHRISDKVMSTILEYIESNLTEAPSVVDLARLADMEVPRFVRAFKARVGVSPVRYIVCSRVEHAKELLRNQSVPVCDIALQLGFANQSHFTTVFRRVAGMTPSVFRSQLRRN